ELLLGDRRREELGFPPRVVGELQRERQERASVVEREHVRQDEVDARGAVRDRAAHRDGEEAPPRLDPNERDPPKRTLLKIEGYGRMSSRDIHCERVITDVRRPHEARLEPLDIGAGRDQLRQPSIEFAERRPENLVADGYPLDRASKRYEVDVALEPS